MTSTFFLPGYDATVDLDDSEVQQLIELIRENDGETDVEALDLENEYPDIYETLDDAYRDAAYEERFNEMVIDGYWNHYLELKEDADPISYCEKYCGFVFEYDEEEYRDEETGELDKDRIKEDKEEYFWNEWLDDYLKTLSDGELLSFITDNYDCDGITCDDYDYYVEIPHEIVEMALRS